MRQSLDLQDGYSCESEGSQDERVAEGEVTGPRPDQVECLSGDSESDVPESA